MRIVMRVEISGTRNGVDWPPAGTALDLPDDEARSMLTSGLAVEAAVMPAVETATVNTKPRKRARA